MQDSIEPVTRSFQRRSAYLSARDLKLLETVLASAVAELAQSGMINAADREYPEIRLRLAAVILGHAGAGERDPEALRVSAIEALASVPDPRSAF